MKLLKLSIIVAFLALPFFGSAQGCNKDINFRKQRVKKPWNFNDLSKGATCLTGKTYEFILPLTKGKDYQLQFFAAPVFNNKINFKIIDQSTNQVVMNLPGQSAENKQGTCVLHSYMDEDTFKEFHPTFDFFPQTSTSIKIIIEVESIPQEAATGDYTPPEKRNRGCVTILVTDSPVPE